MIKNKNIPKAVDPRWLEVKKRLAKAKRIVDLGCGNNPVKGACAAVDLFLDPKERLEGRGPTILLEDMKARGINFINTRIDGPLPFKDKEFDFAYSHHVFEHLEDPACACREMMRIAKSGVIITPTFFLELMFGRAYHRWLVMERKNLLLFFKKRPFEDRPFGESPQWDKKHNKKIVDGKTNPFEMLLNYEGWYQGEAGDLPVLGEMIRAHWATHSALFEIIFIWNDSFEYEVYN